MLMMVEMSSVVTLFSLLCSLSVVIQSIVLVLSWWILKFGAVSMPAHSCTFPPVSAQLVELLLHQLLSPDLQYFPSHLQLRLG
jgi:hypothetical protein